MNKDMLGGDAENLFSRREWYELGRLDATYDAYDEGKENGVIEGFSRGWRAGYDDANYLSPIKEQMVAQEVAYEVGYKKGYSDGSRQAMHLELPVSFIEAIADDA